MTPMTEKQAREIAMPYLRTNDTVIITSDHGVHINSDEEKVREFASRYKPELQVFVLTNETEETTDETYTDQAKEPKSKRK